MTHQFPDFTQARVLVAGDVMLDRYWFGQVDRISPEAPVPIFRLEDDSEKRPGGAANVAMNLAVLGVRCCLASIFAQDQNANILRSLLAVHGIELGGPSSTQATTIEKLRLLAGQHQLLRVDREDSTGFSLSLAEELSEQINALLPGFQLLVLSDYAKGSLQAVAKMIATANRLGVPTVIDPKGRDFQRYCGASAMTPNQKEFELVVGDCSSETVFFERAGKLREALELEVLLITRGANGMTLIEAEQATHIPAVAREVFDVAGAGDTVVAVLAASRAAGCDWIEAARLANLAAGIAVSKLGVATVSAAELHRRAFVVDAQGREHRETMNRVTLIEEIRNAQSRGERIVMTNGCFDLLHAGHVAFLEEARKLGDRLVVAVNSDDSVRRLKGPARPIVSLNNRLAVLAGLTAVDWVVSFDEDTPAQLIAELKPNLLVKGGDYKVEQIAGADCVRENGGEVLVLPFRPGFSTSQLVTDVIAKHHGADDTVSRVF